MHRAMSIPLFYFSDKDKHLCASGCFFANLSYFFANNLAFMQDSCYNILWLKLYTAVIVFLGHKRHL